MSRASLACAGMFAMLASQAADIDAMAKLARAGWDAARAAAVGGGSSESLAPARSALAELDKLVESSRWRLQGTYARSLVAAAIAAAQEERAEMEVHLTHARDLSARLQTSTYPADWPLPIDEAAGELWLEVDGYAEALASFQRAVAQRPQPRSWLGLARSAARLKDNERACEGYRQAARLSLADEELAEAREYLARCP